MMQVEEYGLPPVNPNPKRAATRGAIMGHALYDFCFKLTD
jgi:hypothetical protein